MVTGDDAEEVQEQNKALQHGAEPVLSQQRRRICGGQRAAVVDVSYAVPARRRQWPTITVVSMLVCIDLYAGLYALSFPSSSGSRRLLEHE